MSAEFTNRFDAETRNHVVRLYHGSRRGIRGTIQPISRKRCDFGQGFYMGTEELQPKTLVANESHPVFYTLSFDLSNLRILSFEPNFEWLVAVAFFRGKLETLKHSAVYAKLESRFCGYDVYFGYIADDSTTQIINGFISGQHTYGTAVACLHNLKLGQQYVAATPKACRQIAITNEHAFTETELQQLRALSKRRTSEANYITMEALRNPAPGKHFREMFEDYVRGI